MQSPETANGEGYVSVLASPSQAAGRAVNGYGAAQSQHFSRAGSFSETPASTIGYGATREPENGDGSRNGSLWRRQDTAQPATSVDSFSGSPSERGKAWEGGLWSDNNNIWSTGPQPLSARARRSMELPPRAAESLFGRQSADTDSRRSLDSLSTLQAIWQAQQHQPAATQQRTPFPPVPPYSDRHHEQLLSQQLNSLAVHGQDRGPHLQQQINFRPANGGMEGLHHHGGLGFAQGAEGLGELQPILHAGLPISQPQYGVDGFRSSQPVANGGGYQNGGGYGAMSVGLKNGLTAAQLHAALHDPATANLLRQLEAGPRSQMLEETLLLARRASNGHTALQNAGIRQPPPPPPRSARPQLPPPMPMQPLPPPRLNGAVGAKKAAGFLPQRTSLKDRSSLLGSKPKANIETLNKALEELVESLHPSAEELQKQQEGFQKVSRLLKARWPHAKVHQFGSTANSLSICNNNDIDVCLEMVEPEGDPNFKAQLIEEMGDLMMDAGMANVLPLPKARVPVVKFAVPETGTKVDVSVNNTLAIINTKLLRDYAAIDGRLLQLAFIVKHWAKRRQVNDSYRGTLSSYCYVLMCIHHLQTRPPPILPCLQAIQPPTHIRTIGRWNCDYYDKPMPEFGKENKESLAQLVWSFFENWAWRHDYNNVVISVRTASLITKAHKDWTRRIGNERHLICIEDPFETSHDLGRTVDRQTSSVLHKEFERAASVLRDQEEPLAQLFEPYRTG